MLYCTAKAAPPIMCPACRTLVAHGPSGNYMTLQNLELPMVADSSGHTIQFQAVAPAATAGELHVENMVMSIVGGRPTIAHGDIKSNSLAAHHAAEARQLRALPQEWRLTSVVRSISLYQKSIYPQEQSVRLMRAAQQDVPLEIHCLK